jgi:hypothetical protein
LAVGGRSELLVEEAAAIGTYAGQIVMRSGQGEEGQSTADGWLNHRHECDEELMIRFKNPGKKLFEEIINEINKIEIELKLTTK